MKHFASSVSLILLTLCATAAPARAADRIWIVKDGKPAADVYAGAAEWSAAERFVSRIEQWSGARLMLFGPTDDVPADRKHMARVMLGTPASNRPLAAAVEGHAGFAALGEQGYLLRALSGQPSCILAAGKSTVATTYALGELMNYRLQVERGGNIWCEPFEVAEQPAMPYRWFWLSTSYAHWDPSYGGPHITDEALRTFGPLPDGTDIAPASYPGQTLGPVAYLNTYKAMVDWMAEHKLNGAILFGFLNSGLDPAREVATYARRHGVDILAGVGTMGYWGTYYGGVNEFNLDQLEKLRPELFRKNARGVMTPCPSDPKTQAYWRRAGEWIAQAIPELGGLYLENGDFTMCPCDVCKAQRAKETNDSGCYYDMAASVRPIIDGAKSAQPKWKYVYASYTFFSDSAMKRGSTRLPPRFPQQLPADAICQWTVTGQDQRSWPEGLKAPTAHSIGLFHSPSVWGNPDGSERWWAGPGSSHDDASRLVRLYCQRSVSSGLDGMVIKGMKNWHSPGPLLTYLALEEFSWHPTRTLDEWQTQRLPALLGGAEHARTYLRLARDSSRAAADRQKLLEEAQATLKAPDLSPRAMPYWRDLVAELQYRTRLLQVLNAASTRPSR